MKIEANQIYRHFKGNLYRVITLAKQTETEETLVIYQALYGDYQVYARPLTSFTQLLDPEKYPEVSQKRRFEPVEQMVDMPEKNVVYQKSERQETGSESEYEEETVTLDPLLEEYLDTDSYREKLNILHGLHHRITEHMLLTMAVVMDFELPEGSLEEKYNALNDCLLTREKYECDRMGQGKGSTHGGVSI